MWARRIVLLALLGLMLLATWQIGVMMDRPDLVWGLVFGAVAGMPAALLVLATARSGEQPKLPAPPPAPQLPPRQQLEKDLDYVGFWTTINKVECYIVPATEPLTADGELVMDWNDADVDTSYYVLGEFRSADPFSVAAIENEYGVSRRPYGGFPSEWFWGPR